MSTRFLFSIPEQTHVNAVIYHILGKNIKQLLDKNMQAGSHEFIWNGKSDNSIEVASGIYFIHLKAGEHEAVKKILLVK